MRRGFTLVELLVAMTIIIILAGMTLAVVNIAANGDRVPGASRLTQSMILGARDRAIYAGEPRGVRLIKDPDKASVVSSFVFIGAPQSYGENRGTVTVHRDTTTGVWHVTEDNPTFSSWGRMVQRGLLIDEARITFGNDKRWYTLVGLTELADGRIQATLTRDYAGQPPAPSLPSPAVYGGLNYRVSLAPSMLPGEEPRTLARGVVIDIKSSNVPDDWFDSTTNTASDRMDILFNERGTVHGPLASKGVLSLVIADIADIETGFDVTIGNNGTTDVNGDGVLDERQGDERILALYTNSGTVVITPVDETDADGNNVRDDPFLLAETGGED